MLLKKPFFAPCGPSCSTGDSFCSRRGIPAVFCTPCIWAWMLVLALMAFGCTGSRDAAPATDLPEAPVVTAIEGAAGALDPRIQPDLGRPGLRPPFRASVQSGRRYKPLTKMGSPADKPSPCSPVQVWISASPINTGTSLPDPYSASMPHVR